jgi:hypothetical protein
MKLSIVKIETGTWISCNPFLTKFKFSNYVSTRFFIGAIKNLVSML